MINENAKRIEILERRISREKQARKLAEDKLEKYSLEIFETSESLKRSLALSEKKQDELAFLAKASYQLSSDMSMKELMSEIVSLTAAFIGAARGVYFVTQDGHLTDKNSVKVWEDERNWIVDNDCVESIAALLPLDKTDTFDLWLVTPIGDEDSELSAVYPWMIYTNFTLLNNCVGWLIFLNTDDCPDEDSLYVLDTARSHIANGIRRRLTDVKILKRTVQLQDTVTSLEQAKRQLVHSEKMASLGQLSAGVAHEINNPVAFVYSNMQILQKYLEDYKAFQHQIGQYISQNSGIDIATYTAILEKCDIPFIDEDGASLVAENLDGLFRVKEIVENLKSFSHAGDEEFSQVSLYECVDAALKIAWNTLKYNHKVDNQIQQDCPVVMGNKGQLQQVFVNLFVNAAQAMEGGGVLTLSQLVSEERLVIHVSDNGCGMEQETVEKLFTPFFTTKPLGVGTGLGLSISYAILEAHSVEIQVESVLNRGTTFHLSFPMGTI